MNDILYNYLKIRVSLKWVARLLFLCSIQQAAYALSEADEWLETTTTVVLREQATKSSKSLGNLKKGTVLKIIRLTNIKEKIGSMNGEWVQVKVAKTNQEGYIYDALVVIHYPPEPGFEPNLVCDNLKNTLASNPKSLAAKIRTSKTAATCKFSMTAASNEQMAAADKFFTYSWPPPRCGDESANAACYYQKPNTATCKVIQKGTKGCTSAECRSIFEVSCKKP